MDPNAGKREADGRFKKGCKGGPGNPHAESTARFRAAVYRAVSEGDLEEVTQKVIDKAKAGDLRAAKLLFETLSIAIKQVEANIATHDVTPEEASRRVKEFFGIN